MPPACPSSYLSSAPRLPLVCLRAQDTGDHEQTALMRWDALVILLHAVGGLLELGVRQHSSLRAGPRLERAGGGSDGPGARVALGWPGVP